MHYSKNESNFSKNCIFLVHKHLVCFIMAAAIYRLFPSADSRHHNLWSGHVAKFPSMGSVILTMNNDLLDI
jgi:hypothetical protein